MMTPATPSDHNNILTWISELSSSQFNWSPESLAKVLHEPTFVVREAEQVCAFVTLKEMGSIWEILVLATRPIRSRQGLMRGLLKQIISAAGHDRLIWLEVHEMNTKARSLYESLGFKQVGLRRGYYRDGGAAVLYERAGGTG